MGGAFIKGANINLPAGTDIYVQPESPVTIQGVVIGGDGLNHANDLVNATKVSETAPDDVDAVTGETIDDVDNSADQGANDASDVEDTTDTDSEDKADNDDELDSDSVVPESKPAVNVSQPIAVVKRS